MWSCFTFVFIRSHSSTETLLPHLAAEVRTGTPPPVRTFASSVSIFQVLDLIKLIVCGLCSVYSYLKKILSASQIQKSVNSASRSLSLTLFRDVLTDRA